MSIQSAPHINFQGQARAALAFYHTVFGGQLLQVTHQQMGSARRAEDTDAIAWGQIKADNGFCVMAHDVPTGTPWSRGDQSFFVSVRADAPAEITALWHTLASGGEIIHPLAPAAWTALYGMLQDRFGVTWVLDVTPGQDTAG